jgi:SAM-dependent methyltransferase
VNRRNLALRTSESWRPPALRNPTLLRRLGDLQLQSIWRDLRPLLAQERGDVLDVGCGEQPYRSLLTNAGSYQGLDIADANDRFGYGRDDTLYVNGYPWPVPGESIDLALCTEVLEHVLEPADLLTEVKRCLRPGGRLLMTVPFAARWHFVPFDYWRFTPSAITHLLVEAGFVDVRIYSRGNPMTVAAQKVLALIAPLRPGARVRRSSVIGASGAIGARTASAIPLWRSGHPRPLPELLELTVDQAGHVDGLVHATGVGPECRDRIHREHHPR